MSQLLADIEALVTPPLTHAKVELVDVTYQKTPAGWVLCFTLDKAGGLTLNDCAIWSEQLGMLLDQVDLIPNAYSLEISSPGIRRPLKKLKDFERFKGQRVTVKLYAPLNGQKNFHGTLMEADEEQVRLELEGNGAVSLPRTQIARSHLDPLEI